MTELERIELAARRVAAYCFTAVAPLDAKLAFERFADELHAIVKRKREQESAAR